MDFFVFFNLIGLCVTVMMWLGFLANNYPKPFKIAPLVAAFCFSMAIIEHLTKVQM